MRLGIVTDCTHYHTSSGTIATENHILLRQFQQLATHFDQTIIVCPFGEMKATTVTSSYTNTTIQFKRLPLVGGNKLADKLTLLATIPKWLKAFKHLHANTDVVYQRFPNNLNIPGFIYFWLLRKKVFATYTGTWKAYRGEPISFRLQRWILQRAFRGPVWVYDNEPQVKSTIKIGFSPSYSQAEWQEEEVQVQQRINKIETTGMPVFRFITVGTLINYKNQLAILVACKQLKQSHFPFILTIVGDGPMKREIETYITANNLWPEITMVGKKDHVALRDLYRNHDFIVQAPLKEGFGKVPIEGCFHGLIPIINNISMAASITSNGAHGFLFDACKSNDLVNTLSALPSKIEQLPTMIYKGRAYAKGHTLEAWASDYYNTVSSFYSDQA